MRRLLKRVLFCLLAVVFLWAGALLADRQLLSRELIRIHVVANSDEEADQNVKQLVADSLVHSLREGLQDASDVNGALEYLQSNLPKLQTIALRTLQDAGYSKDVHVDIGQQPFDIRVWNGLRIPSGIYHTLRITIGAGEGKNWWGVLFPGHCADKQCFSEEAVQAGMSADLIHTLEDTTGYEVRFILLDSLGEFQKLLFS